MNADAPDVGKVRWIAHSRENHYLDCESMQLAAAHLLSLGTIAAGTRRPHTGPRVRPPIVDDSSEGATIEDGLAPPSAIRTRTHCIRCAWPLRLVLNSDRAAAA